MTLSLCLPFCSCENLLAPEVAFHPKKHFLVNSEYQLCCTKQFLSRRCCKILKQQLHLYQSKDYGTVHHMLFVNYTLWRLSTKEFVFPFRKRQASSFLQLTFRLQTDMSKAIQYARSFQHFSCWLLFSLSGTISQA